MKKREGRKGERWKMFSIKSHSIEKTDYNYINNCIK
jgi:hypothetical protein